jgi:hypothetical protein
MNVPEGYNHKATSESFNGTEKVSIYYSNEHSKYLLTFGEQEVYFNKTQLELIVHAGTDVLDNAKI